MANSLIEKIKISLNSIYVRDNKTSWGKKLWIIRGFVKTTDFMHQEWRQVSDAFMVHFTDPRWTKEVDVEGVDSVKVEFDVKTGTQSSGYEVIGVIHHTLRYPYSQGYYVKKTRDFDLTFRVEMKVRGKYGSHGGSALFACRTVGGKHRCVTVNGTPPRTRIEFCPVRPTPPDTATWPARPALARGIPAAAERNGGPTLFNLVSPINAIPNPPVIPILSADKATADTAARIEFSYYRPKSLSFTDDDPRLTWTHRGPGAVEFLKKTGRKVLVYGKRAGDVLLQVHYQKAIVATYRAIVGPILKLPYRVTILNGRRRSWRPPASPKDISLHMAYANIFMRQLGIALVVDTSKRRRNGARATDYPGIFRINNLPKSQTRGVRSGKFITRKNYSDNVLNILYIHSDRAGNLGVNQHTPQSGAGVAIADSKAPSVSWISPTGVAPDGTPANLSMKLIAKNMDPRHPRLVAVYITGAHTKAVTATGYTGDKLAQYYALTLAHEIGHALNLNHRDVAGSYDDGLTFPGKINIMGYGNVEEGQDFDRAQARAARQSPLVKP